jgi:bifunctional non-homologous end joining protein LigD
MGFARRARRPDPTVSRERLQEYRAKRRFDVTSEPSGDEPAKKETGGRGYVIQKHAASRLHYDFRLEFEGVLWSWAVPKGPSLSPTVRRMAARTEDHPLDYADFEGVIPEDEYGGGSVVVWDQGTWEPEGDAAEMMKKGRLRFTLSGTKLKGRWNLVRTGPAGPNMGAGGKESWLLIKGRDEFADDDKDIVAERPESVVSGRTVEEVGDAKDRVWHSNRVEKKGPGKALAKFREEQKPAAAPSLIELVKQLPSGMPLTNLDKVLWPEQGVTKGELIAYLAIASERMLAQMGARPLTLVRCPNGHNKQCFFQKHAKDGVPAAVKRVEIEEENGVEADYMMVDDLPGLLSLAQLGVLEIHTWGCHADQVEKPDQMVFDLDPDVGLGWDEVVRTAIDLRARLQVLGLESFVKTTGGKGLHVVAPIERRVEWDTFKAFTKRVAEVLEEEHPTRYTTNPLKAKRRGKIFVDYLRNARGASAIAAYSPRRREGAPVACPITWEELEAGVDPASFTIRTMAERLSAADPWAGYAKAKQGITAAAKKKVGLR